MAPRLYFADRTRIYERPLGPGAFTQAGSRGRFAVDDHPAGPLPERNGPRRCTCGRVRLTFADTAQASPVPHGPCVSFPRRAHTSNDCRVPLGPCELASTGPRGAASSAPAYAGRSLSPVPVRLVVYVDPKSNRCRRLTIYVPRLGDKRKSVSFRSVTALRHTTASVASLCPSHATTTRLSQPFANAAIRSADRSGQDTHATPPEPNHLSAPTRAHGGRTQPSAASSVSRVRRRCACR